MGEKGANPRVNQFYNPLPISYFALFTLQLHKGFCFSCSSTGYGLHIHTECLPFVKRIISLKIEEKGNRRVVQSGKQQIYIRKEDQRTQSEKKGNSKLNVCVIFSNFSLSLFLLKKIPAKLFRSLVENSFELLISFVLRFFPEHLFNQVKLISVLK